MAQIHYIGVEFGWTDIDLFVDISDQIANRIKAEALYQSQGHTTQLAHQRLEAFAGFAGWWSQTGYAEPFIRMKAMSSNYLTVTENELKIANCRAKSSWTGSVNLPVERVIRKQARDDRREVGRPRDWA
ncbi:MAG: hypothetical protein QGF67_02330 [Lentisphaeria bacterium]|nr:hypothetical protein [Lentisphaeria bacterium]MDP7740249.1 hypothetical protein [Lentisphaeria bacterium]